MPEIGENPARLTEDSLRGKAMNIGWKKKEAFCFS
jgi:hypothetical protein